MLQKTRKPRVIPLKHGTLTIIKQPDLETQSKLSSSTHPTDSDDVFLAGNKKAMPEQAKIKLKWKTI